MSPYIEHNDWKINLNRLHKKLLEWGDVHFQAFPWRNEKDPYKVLIAEVMLHRTRADQVVPVYESFIKDFPTIETVANSSIKQLEAKLRTLGLLWRIEKLHLLAKQVVADHQGGIPNDWDALVSLPGVSHYIASAVRCFAFGEVEAIVDTNTLRISSRLFCFEVNDSTRRRKPIHQLLCSIVHTSKPADFNYAMIDLAHQICQNKLPQCSSCPISDISCCYFNNLDNPRN